MMVGKKNNEKDINGQGGCVGGQLQRSYMNAGLGWVPLLSSSILFFLSFIYGIIIFCKLKTSSLVQVLTLN